MHSYDDELVGCTVHSLVACSIVYSLVLSSTKRPEKYIIRIVFSAEVRNEWFQTAFASAFLVVFLCSA